MKGLIVTLVLALVEPVFHMGKTYLYGYDSIIVHGLPKRGLAMAGMRLTAKVEISRVSQTDHLLQIRSPKLEEHNGFWPMDPFIPSLRLSETIAECLSQAFKFEYTEGRVGSIFVPEDCPILCTNLVRGILNMMQITIKKSQNVYELQEAGIEGICQTRYVIQDDSKNNRATISKSKDLTDCQEKAVKNIGMGYIRPCPTCVPKVRNIKGTVMFTYKMKYDDSGVSLTSATSEQVYQISPFNEPNGAAIMEARQELSLVGVKRTPISAPETRLQKQGSLRYHFSGELLQMPIPLIRIKNLDLQLTETLRQLIQHNEKGSTKEASVKFLQMVQLFRVATLDQIESLWLQFVNQRAYRSWFLSTICAAGATDTFRFLKQKIHDEKLNIWEAAATLPLAFHFVTPNKQTLEVASPLHDLATEATSKRDAKDMSLALKAIGNAGEPASIKRILKFLPTFSSAALSLPNRIHADAVLALRKIARKDPAKVRDIALQVFRDITLAPNVRMVACVVLFETKPALPMVTALASSLLTEPSLQVASFTYSHMKALAAGRIPQLHKLSSACNIAIKLLSPRLDRLSYRYSKVINVGDYSPEYQAGAIWRIYLMNSPSTMFPSDIITKVRGYYANTAADIIEVALRSQGLAKLIRKQNIRFAEYDTYKTLKELGKTFLGWKELPSEDPLVSAYIKVLGQEIAFVDIDKDAIQQIMMHLTGSSNWQPVVKKIVEEVQRGISGRWTLPVMVGELWHVVPTAVGVPLQLGLCGAVVGQAAADVDIQMSPPLPDNFRPSQLLETKMDVHADIRPKVYFHMIAMMGINTQYFQSGLEFHAEFRANTTTKFDARINMKEKNLKIETLPCHQEAELAAVRSEVYAISRNMEEVDSEKESQLIPKEVPNISDQPFEPPEGSSRPGSWKQISIPSVISKGYEQGSEEAHHPNVGRLYTRMFCKTFESLGCSTCLSLKSQNSAFLGNTYLHKFAGELEAKIILNPVHTDADIEKIELEIQAGSKAASKIIDVASSGSKEEEETSPYEDIKAKLKKILGIESVFMVSLPVYQFWFKPADEQDPGREILNSSITSSSSSASNEGISRAMSQGSLKWGKDCQDYQIASQIATGQFAAYPAMQMKLEWLKVPSIVQTTARWFYSFLPGAAYVLGYSLRQQLGPSHQAALVMALTSPRTCDVVFKLPEDCSPELKFLVMMKRLEESADLTAINVRLASHEVDMYVSNGLIQLKINGVQTPRDVPYTSNSDASILISSEEEGLALKAPDYGIDKLYYDGHRLEVAFWMAGKTCGICGKYDAEKEREYQMPSGYLAKDAVSFGQSWLISEDPCTGACKLQRKFVKIEKPVAFEKTAAKCFSVEPVLRCVEGCSATGTVPVSVGFHCVPADSALSLEGQHRLGQKSEDIVFVFDVGKETWKFYDWSKITTVAAFGKYDPELMCYAHSKGSRIVLKGDVPLKEIVDPAKRAAWISQQVHLAKNQYMDGINIDIEQEVNETSPEYYALTKLVQETTDAFHREIPGSQVTFDVAWSPACIDNRCYNYTGIADACDFLFVMSYDEQSQIWTDCIAKANAPYLQTLIGYEEYIAMGIDPKKLVMGVPWYGYDYVCQNLSMDHVCSLSKVPFRGAPCSDAAGRQVPYGIIMKQVNSSLSGVLWDEVQKSPFYEYKDSLGNFHQVWFDDPRSISLKAAYVKNRGLRGIGMWNGNSLDYSREAVAEQQTEAMWQALTP
ncbi:hypothetical protein WISP_111067 [Willisornis vidua]|uniref:Phosvitin n=1 Tax=Willisornis vidua TaxID=1566151 RepID=A0ABQ9CVU0_9PASS|nr:hypothetical protein WISP_111067 [Willisornis vidua]